MNQKLYSVYILQSKKHGRYYVGMSGEPETRLYFHNQGLNTSTRSGVPWIKVWQSEAKSKLEALQFEKKIKKRGAGRFLEENIR